jgi:HEAT repeat protein
MKNISVDGITESKPLHATLNVLEYLRNIINSSDEKIPTKACFCHVMEKMIKNKRTLDGKILEESVKSKCRQTINNFRERLMVAIDSDGEIIEAIEALGIMKCKGALSKLKQLLKSKDKKVRLATAKAIKEIEDRQGKSKRKR